MLSIPSRKKCPRSARPPESLTAPSKLVAPRIDRVHACEKGDLLPGHLQGGGSARQRTPNRRQEHVGVMAHDSRRTTVRADGFGVDSRAPRRFDGRKTGEFGVCV